jgi:hypothetical protein
MAGAVPPQIESPKTFIGVSTRELAILGISGLIGLVTLFIPVHLAVRIGGAVLIAGLGLAVAFGRDRRSGKTIEAFVFDLLRFYSRKRFRQKGASEEDQYTRGDQLVVGDELLDEVDVPPTFTGLDKDAWIRVKPLPLGMGLIFSVLSFAFLTSLLAWIWLGGLAEIKAWIGVSGF